MILKTERFDDILKTQISIIFTDAEIMQGTFINRLIKIIADKAYKEIYETILSKLLQDKKLMEKLKKDVYKLVSNKFNNK
jgi:hypothetical protein